MHANIDSANRVVIHREALRHNYRIIRQSLPATTSLLAMVKGDGYGHDMIYAASSFSEEGCHMFGVAEVCEGVTLRQAGVIGDIFVMLGVFSEQAELLIEHGLTPLLYDHDTAVRISSVAALCNKVLPIHVKVDCGMGRLGILPENAAEFVRSLGMLPGIKVAGLASHFPEADDPAKKTTVQAFNTFSQVLKTLGDGFSGSCHIANSGAMLNFPHTCCDIARAGIALYGYAPDGNSEHGVCNGIQMRPAMSYTTRILQIKEVPAGTGISYGHTFVTTRPTRLAVLPVGYEDGYSRLFSNRADVLIHGKRAAVRGRVCMNLCMVDCSDIDGVKPGDEAVLLGCQETQQIDANELARHASTISYEILCMLGNNNQRILK